MLFEQLVAGPSRRAENLQRLKNCELPILLVGAAQAAQLTLALLRRNGIAAAGCCVSDACWKPGMMLEDMAVRKLSECLAAFDRVAAVLANATSREKIERELRQTGKVAQCLFFDAPNVDEIYDCSMLETHKDALETLYRELADDFSRKTMVHFLNARILGDPAVLDRVNAVGEDQYFPDFIRLTQDESFVDCGAYTGDTFLNFLKHANGFARYYAFECDEANFRRLAECAGNRPGVVLLPQGVSDHEGTARLAAERDSGSRIAADGGTEIELTTIDSVLARYGGGCTYIKMDIEGSELAALHGAAGTIRRHRPKLAVCVYHKAEDLWTIPQYIHTLHPGYKFYLRRYAWPFTMELVLYALP